MLDHLDQLDWLKQWRFLAVALPGKIESRCRFDGAREAAILTMLLAGRSAADHLNRWRGSWAFDQALICHMSIRIVAALQ